MGTEVVAEEQGHKKGRHRKKQLYNSILQQMEFYFSDSNLTKDRFLSQLLNESPDIDINVFLKFNKLTKLTTSTEEIAKAISKSELIELSEDKTKVRRKVPVVVKENVEECTVYVERLKSDATHDWLKSIFSEFGKVVYVSIPKYKHNGMIKGFAFVEYDKPEEAEAALQFFESIDCKIPSDLEPQQLCSIATFEPTEKHPNGRDGGVKHETQENGGKIQTEKVATVKEDIEIQEKSKPSDDAEDMDIFKKLKVDVIEEQRKKRKLSDVELNDASEEGGEKKKLKTEDETKASEKVPLETMSDVESEEKRKRKQKKSNRKKMNLKEIGLQILSKKDWKKMRNRYLDKQKKMMKELKMHLYKKRFNNRYMNMNKKFLMEEKDSKKQVVTENSTPKEDTPVQFIPGTIVKVVLPEPCENNKKLKTEFKELSSEIKFVDIPLKIGSEEVFVRFSNNENARSFCESNDSKGKACILEGDDEKLYWKKIEASRQEKQKKLVGKQRGRDKLLKKAEKQAAKHVRFDNNDSE